DARRRGQDADGACDRALPDRGRRAAIFSLPRLWRLGAWSPARRGAAARRCGNPRRAPAACPGRAARRGPEPAGPRGGRRRAGAASVIVMDDGFQNPSLGKNFSVLVIDGRRGIGNGRVFPAGPLRAPLEIQLMRAQALIVVGEIAAATSILAKAEMLGVPVFH